MAIVNISSIMNKVQAYSRTANGKLRMKERIEKYANDGKNKTEAGAKIITEKEMYEAASKMIQVLRNTAQSHSLPASIMNQFDFLDASSIIKMPDGSSTIYIYFGGDLHRESLYPKGYDGVDNIIAVLNNGYHAKDYVYGWWDNHAATAENSYRSGPLSSDAWIRSKKDRDGLHFIEQAVQDFNGNYGSDYNVTAFAGDDYL